MNMNNRNMGENPSCGMQPVQTTQPMPERMYADNMRRGQPMMGSRAAYQTRCGLMRQINEASFAMDDAQLFLDTHPDNAAAMQYFRNAAAMRRNAMDAYQRQFGPLMADEVTGRDWNWVADPWPWEGGI